MFRDLLFTDKYLIRGGKFAAPPQHAGRMQLQRIQTLLQAGIAIIGKPAAATKHEHTHWAGPTVAVC
ncbi:MAG: hypothetical protein R3E89_18005 [Thiolinea sp.]